MFSPSALVSMTARRLRPTSREISWVRPPILPSPRLPVAAGVRRTRQHLVLGSDPAGPPPLEPPRHPGRERRRAQHAGAAELDEDAALGVVEPVPGDAHLAELVGGAAVVSEVVGHGRKASRVPDRSRTGGSEPVRRPGSQLVGHSRSRQLHRRRATRQPPGLRHTSGSFHGGRCVSTSRLTPPALTAAAAAREPERWMPGTASRPSTKAESTRARSAARRRGVRLSQSSVSPVKASTAPSASTR